MNSNPFTQSINQATGDYDLHISQEDRVWLKILYTSFSNDLKLDRAQSAFRSSKLLFENLKIICFAVN